MASAKIVHEKGASPQGRQHNALTCGQGVVNTLDIARSPNYQNSLRPLCLCGEKTLCRSRQRLIRYTLNTLADGKF